MLVNMKYVLNHANENNYALMAINCCNMECVKAVISAAEYEKSAVIINISPRQFKAHANLNAITPIITNMATLSKVPIVLNLDHGIEYDDIASAISNNFTNIMFDGSALPYEENLKITKLISDLSHANGCTIEAELGHVGQASIGDGINNDFYTNVNQAIEFVRETKVDALAVAIGTAHGKYPKGYIPTLDFDRLRELKNALKLPLVLHGGSGAGKENIQKAISLGINKINVCTDVFALARDTMKNILSVNPNIDYMDLCHEAELSMQKYIQEYMRMIGSSNRYEYSIKIKKEFD